MTCSKVLEAEILTSFTSHLHASLQNSEIKVFIESLSLKRGNQVSKTLLRAIEDSRISVIVFSRNYADSQWCLQELEKIMEYRRTIGQVVLPVFYNVDLSEVHHQTSEFGNAFQNLLIRIAKMEHNKWLLEEKKVESPLSQCWELRWRPVLHEAAIAWQDL